MTTSPQKLSNEITHFDIVGKVGDNIILHKYGKNYFEINAYNANDLSLNWSKKLQFKYKKLKIIDLVITNTGAYAFYSVKNGNRTSVLVQPYDFQFRITGEPMLVNYLNYGDETVRLNHNINRSRFVLEIIDKQSADLNVEIIVMDADLNKLYSQKIKKDNDWVFKESLININGEVVVVFEKAKSGLFAGDGIEMVEFIGLTADTLKSQIFENENFKIKNLKYAVDQQNGFVQVGGIYTESADETGYHFSQLDMENMEWQSSVFNIFDKQINDKTAKKALLGSKSQLSKLKVLKLIPTKNRGTLLVAEFYEKNLMVNSSANIYTDIFAGRERDIETYEYGDLVVLTLDDTGAMENFEVLKKRQYSENDNGIFSSVGVLNNGKNIRLVFNEKIDYISPVNGFTINKKGASGIQTLFNSEKYDMLMSPKHGEQISHNQMVIPAYTTRNYFVLALLEW